MGIRRREKGGVRDLRGLRGDDHCRVRVVGDQISEEC